MNVIIKNQKTGHQQTIDKDAWEKGQKWFVGYHLVGDEPDLLPVSPKKKLVVKERIQPDLNDDWKKEIDDTIHNFKPDAESYANFENMFEPISEIKPKKTRKKRKE